MEERERDSDPEAADEGNGRAWEDWSFDDLERINGIDGIDGDEWWGLDLDRDLDTNANTNTNETSHLPPRREPSPPRPELFRRPSPHPQPAPRPHHSHPTDSSRSRQSAPASRDDWLERLSTRRQEQLLDELGSFDFDAIDNPASPPSFSSAFNISDILGEDASSADAMTPPRTTRPRNSIVDLTDPCSSPPSRRPTNFKRKAVPTSQTSKRRKVKSEDRIKDEDSSEEKENIEELDLTNEGPSADEELLQNQQQQLLATQQAAIGVLKIGKRTCIICMEAYKNATVTTCGHLYCHECLTQALEAGEKNSEKGVGNCPVCRKALNRKKAMQMIPISFMKKSTFKGKARRLAVLG